MIVKTWFMKEICYYNMYLLFRTCCIILCGVCFNNTFRSVISWQNMTIKQHSNTTPHQNISTTYITPSNHIRVFLCHQTQPHIHHTRWRTQMHAFTHHVHTYTHTQHTDSHTRTANIHIPTYNTHACTHMCAHTRMHTNMRTQPHTHASMRTCTHACTHSNKFSYKLRVMKAKCTETSVSELWIMHNVYCKWTSCLINNRAYIMFKHVYLILIKQPVHITIYIYSVYIYIYIYACVHACTHADPHTHRYMPQATNISEIIHTLVISVKT